MMRRKISTLGALVLTAVSCPLAAGATGLSPPVPVSPQGVTARPCPTFSWSLVEGAPEYELVVFEVVGGGDVASRPRLRRLLPSGVQSWTPPVEECLAPGGRYVWTLRAAGEQHGGSWSEAVLFEVVAGPSIGEVEAALATLKSFLAARGEQRPSEVGELARSGGESRGPEPAANPGEPALSRLEVDVVVGEAAAPALGQASLTVADQIHLGLGSDFFKNGRLFLWDDASNLALGRDALSSATGTATSNTAVGSRALYSNTNGFANTASGYEALHDNVSGSNNTASGYRALAWNTADSNTASGAYALPVNTGGHGNTATGSGALLKNKTGHSNTATGAGTLRENTTGNENTAIGSLALAGNTTGSRNIAIGIRAGANLGNVADPSTTMSDNIHIANTGQADEMRTLRIGTSGTHSRTFIAGIHGITVAGSPVEVSSAGQLGVSSSSRRFKEEIEELEDIGDRLLDLRAVTFRYRPELVAGGGDLEVGLIAEEVAEIFPELVFGDDDGRPFGVRYDLLSVLLLEELQRQRRELGRQRAETAVQERRLDTLERERFGACRAGLEPFCSRVSVGRQR